MPYRVPRMDFKGPMTGDRALAEIIARLHEISAIAGLAEGLPPTVHREFCDGLVRVAVHITRTDVAVRPGDDVSEWSECDRDVYAVIAAAAPRPITGPKILDALEASGTNRSEITVKRSLKRLQRWKRIVSSKRSPQGYRLPGDPSDDHPTLFDRVQ